MQKNSSKHKRPFWPDYLVSSVDKIDFMFLEKQGIKAIMIDLDGTVVHRGKFNASKEVTTSLKQQPIKIYIATNRPENHSLQNLKKDLHASGVIHPSGLLGKPFAHYYKKSLVELGLKPSQVVMIGDRFLQDIYGANRAGLTTINVEKLGRSTNPVDYLISKLEYLHRRKILKHYRSITDIKVG